MNILLVAISRRKTIQYSFSYNQEPFDLHQAWRKADQTRLECQTVKSNLHPVNIKWQMIRNLGQDYK